MSDEPFDDIAGDYDATFTHSGTGLLQRESVYHFLAPILKKHSIKNVLELNCGTGEDAVWLAKKGCGVFATDISKHMIRVASAKLEQVPAGIEKRLTFQVLNMNGLGKISFEHPFDLVFSNFGGLNCLAPDQLKTLACDTEKHLTEKGLLAGVVMGRFCAWESFYFLTKFQWKKAWRRLGDRPVKAKLSATSEIDTWYYSPAEFYTFFKDHFKKLAVYPIGFALPPSYLESYFQKHPGILKFLQKMERRTRAFSFPAYVADHYLLVLEKR